MTPRYCRDDSESLRSLPPLPLAVAEWQAIVKRLGLSRQQARVVELLLRCASQRQIAAALSISEPTLKTYMQRIFARTGTKSRMHLAMHVFALTQQGNSCHPKG
jgi:DNA-binding CsgD family transcriptional regulator